ncbi:MAG: hypothetical protein ABI134_13665, partial [Byssovorax sp.]
MTSPDRPRDSSTAAHSRRTMPPPELLDRSAPQSVGALVLAHLRDDAPISRHTGARAEEAHLRSQLVESRSAGDL